MGDEDAGLGEMVTVRIAAKALGVHEKSIHRYLKKGLLTKVKEGSRTLIPMAEVRALRSNIVKEQKQGLYGPEVGTVTAIATDMVTMTRDKYEALLIEIGELRKQSQHLLEYRADIKTLEERLLESERELAAARTRLQTLDRPWWRKLFRK